MSGVNASIQSTLDSEFAKIGNTPLPAAIKGRKQLGDSEPPTIKPVGDTFSSNLDDLIPRVDITPEITSTFLSQLGDAKWQNRKEALDHLAAITEKANKRMKLSSSK